MEHVFSGAGILSVILGESHSEADHFAIATPNSMVARLHVRSRHVPLPLWDFNPKANSRSTGFDAIKMPNLNQPIGDPNDEEIQPLLFDLVIMGEVDEVRRLLPRFRGLCPEAKLELKKLAAFNGPLAMVQLLIKAGHYGGPRKDWSQIVAESWKGENIEVMDWISNVNLNICAGPVHSAGVGSDSAEVFEFWKNNFSEFDYDRRPCIIHERIVSAAKSPIQEIRLSALWKERVSSGGLSSLNMSRALRVVAGTTCSVVLAKTLLECGADVNVKMTRGRIERSPLHIAATRTTAAAAELMKFLLLSGADPNTSAESRGSGSVRKGRYQVRETRTPSMERGAQNISKWLGMTWDELVKWAEDQRRNKSQNDTSSCSTEATISSSADGSTVK